MVSIFLAAGRAADASRSYCAWSRVSRTALNEGAHAAEACALPFRAGRDRPRPGCRLLLRSRIPPLTDRITLSDREVLGDARRADMRGCVIGRMLVARLAEPDVRCAGIWRPILPAGLMIVPSGTSRPSLAPQAFLASCADLGPSRRQAR